MTAQKSYGLLLIIIGIPFGRTALDGILPASYFIAAGLMVILFSPERINDERVQQLKMKALYTAISMGLGLTFLGYVLVSSFASRLPGTNPVTLRNAVSAWDFLAGVLGVSLGLFHFYRWQDARSEPVRAENKGVAGPGGGRFRAAPMAATVKWMSFAATTVLLAVATALARKSGLAGWLPASGFAGLVAGGLLCMVRGYAVEGKTLLIQRPLWSTRLPLEGLVSAQEDAEAMKDSFRLFGNGGFFGLSGRFHNARLGHYRAFVTDPAHAVVLRWADRTIVTSPAAPREFIRELPVEK